VVVEVENVLFIQKWEVNVVEIEIDGFSVGVRFFLCDILDEGIDLGNFFFGLVELL
jgi:hypothetical protein